MLFQPSNYELQTQVFKALGHPVRLFLIEVLAAGEQCVCDLAEMVGSDVSTVSRHLSQLKQAGIVGSEKQGQKVIYRLACSCVVDFIRCVGVNTQSSEPIQLAR